MADLPNDFWSGWIVLITVISFIGLAWLVISVYFLPADSEEPAEHVVWDENLREGNNPAPMWWFWMILAAMVISVVYLMLYPGMGSFRGAFRWSQHGQIENSMDQYEEELGALREGIAISPIEDLQQNSQLMQAAGTIYNENCSACHGYEAQGQADMFPNLADGEWQWGGDEGQIEQTLRNGRTAVMVAWGAVLGEEGVANVADYVLALGAGATENHPGQAQYNQFCVACHGPEGTGNVLLGAPNLADDIWLYGGDRDTIMETLNNGRNGQMPAFGQRLDDTQIRLLVAWLLRDK